MNFSPKKSKFSKKLFEKLIFFWYVRHFLVRLFWVSVFLTIPSFFENFDFSEFRFFLWKCQVLATFENFDYLWTCTLFHIHETMAEMFTPRQSAPYRALYWIAPKIEFQLFLSTKTVNLKLNPWLQADCPPKPENNPPFESSFANELLSRAVDREARETVRTCRFTVYDGPKSDNNTLSRNFSPLEQKRNIARFYDWKIACSAQNRRFVNSKHSKFEHQS